MHPVGRPVTGASKATPFHKSLQPLQTLPVFCLPIPINAPRRSPQNMAGQMRDLHPRKNQKPCVVGDPCQSLLAAKSPGLQIGVATCTAPRGSTKEQGSHFPSQAIPSQIPNVLSHHPKPQIMVARQIMRPSPMPLTPSLHKLQARGPHFRKAGLQSLLLRDACR